MAVTTRGERTQTSSNWSKSTQSSEEAGRSGTIQQQETTFNIHCSPSEQHQEIKHTRSLLCHLHKNISCVLPAFKIHRWRFRMEQIRRQHPGKIKKEKKTNNYQTNIKHEQTLLRQSCNKTLTESVSLSSPLFSLSVLLCSLQLYSQWTERSSPGGTVHLSFQGGKHFPVFSYGRDRMQMMFSNSCTNTERAAS